VRRGGGEPDPDSGRKSPERRSSLRQLTRPRCSEFPDFGAVSPLTIGGTATVLQINTADADALWSRALEAGAEVHHEIADQFWGERHGQLTDPFGHRWNIAQHLRDIPADEIAAAAARMFAAT
jgi:PhnB protein